MQPSYILVFNYAMSHSDHLRLAGGASFFFLDKKNQKSSALTRSPLSHCQPHKCPCQSRGAAPASRFIAHPPLREPADAPCSPHAY